MAVMTERRRRLLIAAYGTLGLGIVAAGVALAAMRIAGHKEEWFQALAHLYVGIMIGSYFGSRCEDRGAMLMAVALTVVEVACFLAGRA